MRKLVFLIFMISSSAQLMAQADKPTVLQVLQQLQQTYSTTGFLSFDIQYKYAAEATPTLYEDSIGGQVKLHGQQHWTQLDNTEMINIPGYLITLFKEDKLMYLSAPPPQSAGYSPATGTMSAQWVKQLDSMLARKDQLQARVEETARSRTFVIDYLQPKEWKRISYHIDKRTGYLTGITSLVHADQMYDPSVREKVTGDVYVIVETHFTNYSTAAFDTGLFNAARYFTKKDGQYTSVGAYSAYTVYQASAGL